MTIRSIKKFLRNVFFLKFAPIIYRHLRSYAIDTAKDFLKKKTKQKRILNNLNALFELKFRFYFKKIIG